MGMRLAALLERVQHLYPDKVGVVCGQHRFTYREFVRRVSRLAAALQDEGIRKGDRVAICHRKARFVRGPQVVGDDDREVAWNGKDVGEILVRGESVTPGYWNLPGETKQSFRKGWLCTGDLAVVDEEGYVNIVDRKKDMIVTGGENVYSTEVENVLYGHPAILEAAVIGIPDEKWGEAVLACVVLKDRMEVCEEDLIDFCKRDLARYKAPKFLKFLSTLPRTGSGKIFKKALADKYGRNPTAVNPA